MFYLCNMLFCVGLSDGIMLSNFMQIWICRSRKLNSQLENAIQEAMLELDRMTEQQQATPPGVGSVAVSNESTGRLRRSTHR
jgi:hypothetical protein